MNEDHHFDGLLHLNDSMLKLYFLATPFLIEFIPFPIYFFNNLFIVLDKRQFQCSIGMDFLLSILNYNYK